MDKVLELIVGGSGMKSGARFSRTAPDNDSPKPKFRDVTLACDDRRTIQAHKGMLMEISIVSRGLLRKHSHPYSLVYMRGRRPAPSLGTRRDLG